MPSWSDQMARSLVRPARRQVRVRSRSRLAFSGVKAPAWQGARREHPGSIRPTRNAGRRDGPTAKKVKLFLTGPLGNGPVGDDEELLSGPNEAELAPSQFFDGRGVVTQAVSLERELSILPLESCDRVGHLQIRAPDPGGLDESPLAGNRVGQEDGGRQDQQESCQAAPDRGPLVTVSNLLCAAPCGGAKGQDPLGPVWPSCGGRTGRLRTGASARGREARAARHANPCFGRIGVRD